MSNNYFGEELAGEFGDPPDTAPREPPVTRIVEAMLKATAFKRDRPGNVYRFTGKWWEELSAADLDHLAFAADTKNTSAHRRSEIVKLLGVRAHDMVFEFGGVASSEVAFENGVLDVLTGRLRPHRAEDYLESVLPWEWDGKAICPVWLSTLATFFGEECSDGRHDALQEFAGYISLSTNRFKKALLLIGDGDTGKSLITDIFTAMVGADRTSQLSLEHMDDPTLRGVIKGARLNVASEVSSRAPISDAGFKALIAGDLVLINRKYRPAEMYRSMAKHVFAANSLPPMRGKAAEVLSRFVMLPMDRVIVPRDQDPNLADKLRAEMPGIMAWAIAGARRLLEAQGRFTVITSSADVLEDWKAEVNPMVDFNLEWMVRSQHEFVSFEEIAERLRKKMHHQISTRQVGKWCRAIGLETDTKRVRADGRTVKAVIGWVIAGSPVALSIGAFDGEETPPDIDKI